VRFGHVATSRCRPTRSPAARPRLLGHLFDEREEWGRTGSEATGTCDRAAAGYPADTHLLPLRYHARPLDTPACHIVLRGVAHPFAALGVAVGTSKARFRAPDENKKMSNGRGRT